MSSREPFAEDVVVASAELAARRRDRRRVRRRRSVGQLERRAAMPPFAIGVALMRRSPCGPQCVELGDRAARPRRRAPRAGTTRSHCLEHREVLGVLAHARRAAPGARGRCPRPARRRPCGGRSSPSGVRSTMAGQRGAVLGERAGRGIRPDRGDALVGDVDGVGHATVHGHRVLAVEPAGHEQRFVAVATEEVDELGLRDAREQRRVGDLEPVEVQDRQHRAVRDAGSGRSAPRQLAASGPVSASPSPIDARDHEAGVVERRAEGVHERVAELAALVDRTGRLGRRVRRDAARERELAEEPLACPRASALIAGKSSE